MKISSLPEDEILSILKKVKKVSETIRNPNYPDNKRSIQKGKNCHGGAWARDLGATKKDQSLLYKMRYLVSIGLLDGGGGGGFPVFNLTKAGNQFISNNEDK